MRRRVACFGVAARHHGCRGIGVPVTRSTRRLHALLRSRQPWQWLHDADPDEIPLLDAALLVTRDEYPELPLRACMQQFETLQEALKRACDEAKTDLDRLRALNRFMFDTQGYTGNFLDYQDPRNSYLNDVMERKLGIPITLSILHVELGRGIDIDLNGISFPGHFMVRMPMPGGLLVLDPYHRGKAVSADELKHRLQAAELADEVDDHTLFQWLQPANGRDVVLRMLRNLKSVYAEREDPERALRCADRLVLLDETPSELRDRGWIYLNMGAKASAKKDLAEYLQRAGEPHDREQVEDVLRELSLRPTRLH